MGALWKHAYQHRGGNGCHEKGEDAPEEVMYVKTSYDRNLRNTSQHRNHKGQKMLEADPHLVQCMTFHQDIVAKMAHSVS